MQLPAFVALAALQRAFAGSELNAFTWGPTGSAGFELATQTPTISTASDLDILIRLPDRCDQATIAAFSDLLADVARRAGTRIDAQLETPAGGVALAELVAGKSRVLARASDGARLIADPWQPS
jgi:phosphoribosyl-dephospho-CoA transferase